MSRLILSLSVIALCVTAARAEDDTPAAAKTRKLLKSKVSVDFKDIRLEDCIMEIKDMVKGLNTQLDTKGGVSRNQTITFVAKDATVEEILDGMFKKNGLGYIVISKKGNAYDGSVQIKQGKERGYPVGQEPK